MKLPKRVGVIAMPDTVLLPHSLLPLYVFEPRHRRMLTTCLKSHRMLAVALEDSKGNPSQVAGLGIVRVCLKHEDGSLSLMVQGLKRIKCLKYARTMPYYEAEYEVLDAHELPKKRERALMRKILEQINEPEEVLGGVGEIDVFLNNVGNYDKFIDLLAGSIVTDPWRKQMIMEGDNTQSRLRELAKCFKCKHRIL